MAQLKGGVKSKTRRRGRKTSERISKRRTRLPSSYFFSHNVFAHFILFELSSDMLIVENLLLMGLSLEKECSAQHDTKTKTNFGKCQKALPRKEGRGEQADEHSTARLHSMLKHNHTLRSRFDICK